MAKFSGNLCSVSVSNTTSNWAAGYVTANGFAWTADLAFEPKDTTGFSDAPWRDAISGNKVLTGTIQMFADDTTALIFATNNAGTYPTVVLRMTGSGSGRQVSFTAVLSSMSIAPANAQTGDPPIVTFAFVSKGTVTPA